MDNPEKQKTLSTQDTGGNEHCKSENRNGPQNINTGANSRDTDNIRQAQDTEQKYNTEN